MKKNTRTVIAFMLVFIMVFALAPITALAVSQSEIDELKAQRDEITAQRREKQAVIDQLAAEQAGILEQKLAMDERNEYTRQQMVLNSQEIAMYDDMIKEKAAELEEALRLEEEQLERYRTRVRAMEENGNYNILAMILKTTNLGELITIMDDVGEIMQSDRDLEDAYIAARQNTEAVKADYEATKADIEEKQTLLRAEQLELEKDIEEATQLIADYQASLDAEMTQRDAMQEAENAANAVIDELVAELERQRQEELANQNQGGGGGGGGGTVSGTGAFIWPVPSCTYLTSRFGPRTHPITGVYKNHTGIDIGAASGANILAADGGTVTLAGVNGGYGNCVMIDHGNGYITLYGHMSSIAVTKGSTVSQGDVIGYVGSTGVSTGPHCHYEVWSGGGRIDPEQFYSGLTYSADCGV